MDFFKDIIGKKTLIVWLGLIWFEFERWSLGLIWVWENAVWSHPYSSAPPPPLALWHPLLPVAFLASYDRGDRDAEWTGQCDQNSWFCAKRQTFDFCSRTKIVNSRNARNKVFLAHFGVHTNFTNFILCKKVWTFYLIFLHFLNLKLVTVALRKKLWFTASHTVLGSRPRVSYSSR